MSHSSSIEKNNLSIQSEIDRLTPIVEQLKCCFTLNEKHEILDGLTEVKDFFEQEESSFLKKLQFEEGLILKSLAVIGQAKLILSFNGPKEIFEQRLKELIVLLLPVEKFYQEIGGIVGYHWLTLIALEKKEGENKKESAPISPEPIDISEETCAVRKAILFGIENLPLMAEIYPVGGAADRLRLQDEKTGLPLPAARLFFAGRTLLAGLILDLQAREYLYYKLFKKQVITPLAMMTSQEKDNHTQILAICEENGWFGRPLSSFRFFSQPLVPTMNRQGNWCLQGPLQPLVKPGGHGVIWKLARDEGVLKWLFELKRTKALIRQINNPIAGVDYGLLAFCGYGFEKGKLLGFASCPRQVKAHEGINVVLNEYKEGRHHYILTNIEYCDFKKYRIIDEPASPGSFYSKYPSNTNILFVDLPAVLESLQVCPLPGTLVNLKKTAYKTSDGKWKEEEIARLESTMQNIADGFIESFSEPLQEGEFVKLRTYLTDHERRKTISCAKREFVLGSSLLETPEGCFLDVLKNGRDLLVTWCKMRVPEVSDAAHFFAHGPTFLFSYHPALGPLYSIIGQKIRGGVLRWGAELQLEIAELDIENLDVQGSFIVKAESPLGSRDKDGVLVYSDEGGKCTLKNVRVRNEGIDRDSPNVFWKGEIFRNEVCEIVILGSGAFYAENTVFEGNFRIIVEDGEEVRAIQKEGKLILLREKNKSSSWNWEYELSEGYNCILKKDSKQSSLS